MPSSPRSGPKATDGRWPSRSCSPTELDARRHLPELLKLLGREVAAEAPDHPSFDRGPELDDRVAPLVCCAEDHTTGVLRVLGDNIEELSADFLSVGPDGSVWLRANEAGRNGRRSQQAPFHTYVITPAAVADVSAAGGPVQRGESFDEVPAVGEIDDQRLVRVRRPGLERFERERLSGVRFEKADALMDEACEYYGVEEAAVYGGGLYI